MNLSKIAYCFFKLLDFFIVSHIPRIVISLNTSVIVPSGAESAFMLDHSIELICDIIVFVSDMTGVVT